MLATLLPVVKIHEVFTGTGGSTQMAEDKKKHDWTKEQPHHATTGKITTENYARKHPDKVEWVKNKK